MRRLTILEVVVLKIDAFFQTFCFGVVSRNGGKRMQHEFDRIDVISQLI